MLRSWVESANAPQSGFPIQNLPYGSFSCPDGKRRLGVAIGDYVLDLTLLAKADLFADRADGAALCEPTLNTFMSRGPESWARVRARLQDLLSAVGDPVLREFDELAKAALVPLDSVTLHMPFEVAEYTDFYACKQHAFNVGTMFRGPENALPPNWLHIPIGYNGRASTVVVSGTDIRRPLGQMKPPDAMAPVFGPCQRLDIELELGAVVGLPSAMGEPVSVDQADDMIFGYVLLNDWSARDIQAWEYQPLGPFQGKAFGTSVSPWVVTKAALAPFRVPLPEREQPLLPYLESDRLLGYDLELGVWIKTPEAREAEQIGATNARYLYFSAAQQLAHHAIGGCAMNTGDLLGSGTISGPEAHQYGSLLEMCWGGRDPLTLATGETRTFIEDGDTLTLTGVAEGEGYRIGFGACSGTVLPAPSVGGV
ncbi:MAG: fumarylacetoacetase [Pseudomonadota bacterium]